MEEAGAAVATAGEAELNWSRLSVRRGAARLWRGAAEAAAAPQPSGVAATGSGQWLPAPPVAGSERKRVDRAGTRTACADGSAHAAGQEQQTQRAGRSTQGPGPVAALPQPPGSQSQRQLLPRGSCLAAGAACAADPQSGRQSAAEHPSEIENLQSLECLYLGGNFIKEIPPELANLPSLTYLVLYDNKIQSVPPQLSQLHSLRSLSLHNNLLTYLPRDILNLIHLEELSLRGNPLVVRFVRDLTYDPPTLLELAARTIKIRNISYTPYDLPGNLLRYLSLASNCPNPKCGGVYFDCCVRQIKFVDFCGKYRLPLIHYLCSPECSSP
ncbi:Leucine-rich repeat-containing protein 58 [Sciurus carolinensis]|uniref:Leucine-rich repeat-containing protein 58 n=1 Tax=Sciurus carolinensis TaxID=30640 RepID=A0AA41MF64_SCICA|nr:Leucine-rich repeat-containing protein 58 [Sciurus carolinensis]